MKADVLRYELLLEHGGVYLDADFECHHPLDPLIKNRSRLLVSEFGVVTNSLMGFVQQDSFLSGLVAKIGSRFAAGGNLNLREPHLLTGPYLVDELFVEMGIAYTDPSALLPGDYFFTPRTRNPEALARAGAKRYGTHHALATWRDATLHERLRQTKLRTRVQRFLDLTAE
jgi:hypothetical protein